MATDLNAIWDIYNSITKQEETDHSSENNICDQCNSLLVIDYTNGCSICKNCGTIKEEGLFDDSAEWNNYSNDSQQKKDPSRCGAPINSMLEKSSLSTNIVCRNTFMKKLHMQMSMDYVERSRYYVFEEIQRICSDRGNFSSCITEQAKYYYMILSKRKLSRGLIRKGLISCCILYACKYFNVSRSIKEISKICEISVPLINKTLKIFINVMHDELSEKETTLQSTDCMDLVNRFVNQLEFTKSQVRLIMKSIKKVNQDLNTTNLLECKTPSSVAVSIILYSCVSSEVPINKSYLSKKFDVSIVTINKIYKIIEEYYVNNTLK